MVRLAEYFDPYYNPFWTILQQVGVDAAVSKLDRRFDGEWNNSGDRPWDYAPLHDMKRRYEAAGLELVGIEDYPPMDRARLGLPGADEEIEWVCTLIRNMGRLEIPMLCYNWMGCINWVRTDIARPTRGGAKVTAFRLADLGDPGPTWAGVVPAEQLWSAWERFMDVVVPVAEKAGVRLALHPDDPPIPEVRGVGRIMNSVESFERATRIAPADALGYFNLARTHQMRLLKSQRYDPQMQKWIGGDEDRRRAIAGFQKYLALGGPYANHAQEALASLSWK